MERGSRRAHQDRALLKWNFVWQTEDAPLGHCDELGITAVAVFADHLRNHTKLFGAGLAKSALTASHEVMDADAIARSEVCNIRASFFHHAGHFMSERQGQ